MGIRRLQIQRLIQLPMPAVAILIQCYLRLLNFALNLLAYFVIILIVQIVLIIGSLGISCVGE